MGSINDRMDSNAEIIFGTTSDSTLEKDEVKITIVATGFESKNDEIEEPTEGAEDNTQNAVPLDIETYLDTPPLMRDYVVQYQLN
jgi:cell division protein FtsZ